MILKELITDCVCRVVVNEKDLSPEEALEAYGENEVLGYEYTPVTYFAAVLNVFVEE
jgi:hypothetical protein